MKRVVTSQVTELVIKCLSTKESAEPDGFMSKAHTNLNKNPDSSQTLPKNKRELVQSKFMNLSLS